jgi:hypothetical protein
LVQAEKSPVPLSEELIEQFGEDCKKAIRKQFKEQRDKSFRVRMSGIGKPLCQLQMEKSGAKKEEMPYNSKLRFLFGDMIEAITVLLLKASGTTIDSEQKQVTRASKYFDTGLTGTYDIEIDNKIYDIKSASDWAFKNKFSMGFDAVVDKDVFGYKSQGYLYADAENKKFGGWIVINKSTGEMCIVSPPKNDAEHRKEALKVAEDNIKALMENKPFERCFTDVEEKYRNKLTGNRVLDSVCSFCSFKQECWGDKIEYLPQQVFDSEGNPRSKSPRYYWYTHLADRGNNNEQEKE